MNGWFGHGVVEDGVWRFGATPTKLEAFKWEDVLSPLWRQQHVRHFFKMPNSPADGATHVMLVEGSHETPFFLRFGSAKLFGSFLVFAYNADKREPMFLHCEHCADEVMGWIASSQGTWREEAAGGPYVTEGVSLYQ